MEIIEYIGDLREREYETIPISSDQIGRTDSFCLYDLDPRTKWEFSIPNEVLHSQAQSLEELINEAIKKGATEVRISYFNIRDSGVNPLGNIAHFVVLPFKKVSLVER